MKKNYLVQGLSAIALGVALVFSGCHFGDDSALQGEGYKVDLPEGTEKIKCKPATEKQLEELELQGYQFVTQPLCVTEKGREHVDLDQMATVSFAIPSEFPKEEYYRLMGILVTEEGPVYMVPDIDALERGFVSFETSHFSYNGVVTPEDEVRRREFVKRTAASGWQNDRCNADLEKTLKEKLMETAEDIGLGENDLLGIAAREVLADNGLVKDAMSLIDGKEPADLIAEKIEAEVKARTLGYLFGRLNKNPNDEKVKEFLKTHLTISNAEDWATQLGEGKHPVVIGYEYAHNFAVEGLKDFSVKLCPYVKTVQATATTMEILKKFWANNQMNEMFERYEKYANPDGTMDNDTWNLVIDVRLAAAKSKFGMTSEEIRKLFEDRIAHKKEIAEKERQLEKMITLWENNYWMLQSEAFKYTDYVQRLTVIHNLMERFRKELVRNGNIPNRRAGVTVDELLCEIVEKYLECFPDQKKFYEWIAKNGYGENKFQEELKAFEEKVPEEMEGQEGEQVQDETGSETLLPHHRKKFDIISIPPPPPHTLVGPESDD